MTTLPAGWKPIESAPKDGTEILAWRSDCGQFIASYTSADAFPMTQDELDAWDEETLFAKDWFTQWPQALRLEGSEVPTLWQPLPAAPGTPPASAQPERDWELTCDHCDGDGFVYVERRVGPCATDIQTFKEDCECCEGRGFTIAFADIPGIAGYVKSCRPAPASAQDDAKDDITQRLRDNADLDAAEDGNPAVIRLEREAADEIDRLRRALAGAPAAGDAPQDLLGRLANPLTPYGLLARALRVATGTTLMDMARASGNTAAEISSIEFGRTEPDEGWFERAAMFFASNGVVVPPSTLKAAHDRRAASQQQEG